MKPYERENHNPDTEGYKGLCGWHGMTEGRGPCPNEPYASVKLRYADYQPVQSACVEALKEISQRYGFPIPQEQSERDEAS
ncbi:hypothetical protein HCN51_56635 [Nonomuraea sp. FMUSA5-5]|uniref:Uncharacterized protein n=1 Tax=Nonomuraea composti TaxID=2720023 RepID=A0ABX1BLY5_9ACTN|nr:hypothetical protein [Nonomuraea sp. FMUSA5-5]NJP98753.1 hypothetical protein [Nonomuraea sp. FMUSA5-5]